MDFIILKQNKINKEMPHYLYIHNIYLYQYHDTKPNPINIDWLLELTPTRGVKDTLESCQHKKKSCLKLVENDQ